MKRIIKVTALTLFFMLHITAPARGNEPALPATPSMDVFISLSMPGPSLLAWQREAKRYHARLILRGFLHNSLEETIKALTLNKDNVLEVSVDPTLFDKYRITQVPAVVVSEGDRFDVVYGNTRLTAALETILGQGELKAGARELLLNAKDEHHA